MKIPSRIRRAFGFRPWARGGVVLAYHRIATLEHDPHRLAVTPEAFVAHLDVIRTSGHPLPLPRLVELAAADALPLGAVAITFDDGYADTLDVAAPLLAAAGVPATVFLSTDAIDRGYEFWWDELDRMLLGRSTAPARVREYDDWCSRLRGLDAVARERALAELAVRLGDDRTPRPSHAPLAPHQVTALAGVAGITLGSHTGSHPALAQLGEAAQHAEIARARQRVESLAGRPTALLAYPFGGADAVSARTRAAAAAAGITVACTTIPDTVRRSSDALHLPRMVMRNWTRAEFHARWSAWTGAGVAA